MNSMFSSFGRVSLLEITMFEIQVTGTIELTFDVSRSLLDDQTSTVFPYFDFSGWIIGQCK